MKTCEKCGQIVTHFIGSTSMYFVLCKQCYDEELVRLSADDLRSSKQPQQE